MSMYISILEAILIESLKSNRMDEETILHHLRNDDAEALNNFDDTLDYGYLLEVYRTDPEAIEHAIVASYRIRFVTRGGLTNLLRLKFDLLEERDFELGQAEFIFPSISHTLLDEIAELLSANWKVEKLEQVNDTHCKARIYVPTI